MKSPGQGIAILWARCRAFSPIIPAVGFHTKKSLRLSLHVYIVQISIDDVARKTIRCRLVIPNKVKSQKAVAHASPLYLCTSHSYSGVLTFCDHSNGITVGEARRYRQYNIIRAGLPNTGRHINDPLAVTDHAELFGQNVYSPLLSIVTRFLRHGAEYNNYYWYVSCIKHVLNTRRIRYVIVFVAGRKGGVRLVSGRVSSRAAPVRGCCQRVRDRRRCRQNNTNNKTRSNGR